RRGAEGRPADRDAEPVGARAVAAFDHARRGLPNGGRAAARSAAADAAAVPCLPVAGVPAADSAAGATFVRHRAASSGGAGAAPGEADELGGAGARAQLR